MGRSVKPSCMNTTGIGPAIDRRRARRTGTDAVPACAMRAAGVGRSPPIKKPAAMDAAGFDHGHESGIRRCAFPRRTVRLRPPFAVAGGVACRAEGFRVVLAHSLLQETSAGRNVITLFSTVNNSRKLFFRNVCKCIALHAHPCHAHIHQRLHLKFAHSHAMVVHASTDAAGSEICARSSTTACTA